MSALDSAPASNGIARASAADHIPPSRGRKAPATSVRLEAARLRAVRALGNDFRVRCAALVADGRATFRLELGEAPLAPLPTRLAEDFPPLPFVSAVTRLVYDRGRLLYNARGISAWKRKWRAEESALWICCERDPPVVETVAALALIYDP